MIKKEYYLFAMLSIISLQYLKAQEQKTIPLSDQTKVFYSINDSKKIDGTYSIIKDEDKVFLRGSYKDNLRIGNWYAFNDSGNVFLRYNYDLKKLIFLDTLSISRLKVDVKTDDSEAKMHASIPIPIASIDQYISLLGTELKRLILKDNKNADGTLDVNLITTVDKTGKATYEASYLADGIQVNKRLVISEKAFDLDWIPASYKGQNFDSVFSVKARIDFSQKPGIKQRFIWVY